jgi:uncharacterized protein
VENKGKKEYVRLRIKLAQEKIEAADVLTKNRKYRDAVSRAYYAIFYAAKAFLLHQGQEAHSHKGVDILFRRFCIAHKSPEESFAKMLSVMREERLNADYQEKALITKQDAQEAIDMAQSFLKEIRSLLK